MPNALLANAVEMSITSVASSGLGNVTLNAAVGDNNTFAQAGYLDGPGVSYFIEEANGDYESGVGHLTTTQTILVRDTALEKSVGSTVTRLPATKLTATTGGTVSVRPDALSPLFGAFPTYRENVANYDLPDNVEAISVVNQVPVADRLYLTSAVFLWPRKIASFGVDVHTADAASTNTRVGIYLSEPDGGPGDLLIDTGAIDISASGDNLISAASWATGPGSTLFLPAGLYWYAFLTDSIITRIHTPSSTSPVNFGVGGASEFNLGRRVACSLTQDSVTGALPASATPTNIDNPHGFAISKPA